MTKRTWPSVTNRNVAQPSRVRLVNAPDAGSDVFDVIPVPGTVSDEGTLLNKTLFDGEKAYVDENDIPFATTTGTGSKYQAIVPQWNGLTLDEIDGKILVLKCHTVSTSQQPTLNINLLGTFPLRLPNGNNSSDVAPLPETSYLQPNRNILVAFDSGHNCFVVISSVGKPFGGEYVNTPWSISGGGTGANTAAGARANIGYKAGTNITIDPDGTINATGGGGGGDYVLPKATATVLGGIKVGSGLNIGSDGTLSTVLSSPVSIADGGTGANTAAGARANIGYKAGTNITIDPDGTIDVNINQLLLNMFPVGYVYLSFVNVSPASFIGGTWQQITDRFLYCTTNTETGGSNTHTLTTNEMPVHVHKMATYKEGNTGSFSGGKGNALNSRDALTWTQDGILFTTISRDNQGITAGGDQPHNNMPAYQGVYAWRRTA